MKRFIIVSLFAFLLASSHNVYSAEKGWYLSGNIGLSLSIADDSLLRTRTEAELESILEEDLPTGYSISTELGYDMGYLFGVAVGYDFGNFRMESELVHQKNDFDKLTDIITIPDQYSNSFSRGLDGNLSSLTLLFNGYYDFLKGSAFRPYITGGIGLANVEFETSEDDTVFAYQLGAGISYHINESIALDLRYRYSGASDPHFTPWDYRLGPSPDVEYSGHSLIFGLKCYF